MSIMFDLRVRKLETAVEASTTTWETAEDAAKRRLQRVRLPHAAAADLNELAAWAPTLDENDDEDMTALVRVLPWISSRSIRHLWRTDEQAFRAIFRHYCTRVETGNFTFDYCDALAEFSRRAVNESGDVDVLRDAIRSLAELGYRHNRWRVRDVVTTILQSIRETESSLAATEALRAVSPAVVEWTLTEFSVRSLPPVLRTGIHALLHARPQ
jgi:eukaryotic-like serine/threonine-protein kinase